MNIENLYQNSGIVIRVRPLKLFPPEFYKDPDDEKTVKGRKELQRKLEGMKTEAVMEVHHAVNTWLYNQ